MSGIKINFLNQTPQITAPQTMQNTGFAPIFNFFMPPMNFLPSFSTFDSSFDEFQNMFFNSIRMMEYNIPKAEITENFRPLDYNRTNNSYAPDNSKKISELNPEMQEKTMDLLDYAKNVLGKDVKITSGYRSKAQQEYLIKTTPHLAAKRSAHCEGKAVDLNIIGGTDEDYRKLGDYAKSIGMRWGGDFKKTPERWHFDYQWG